ncbi:MAG: hypothetical protein N2651_08250 [Fimbriimonadales bacterium]|nr:hypothetical protein [Fimbriimonadales bacterium]
MCITSGWSEKRALFAQRALCLLLSFVVLVGGSVSALAQNRPDIVWVQGGHTNTTSAIFSPDGQYFITASSDDSTVKLWRVSDGQLVRTFLGRDPVAISPDGQLLACWVEAIVLPFHPTGSTSQARVATLLPSGR